MASIRGSTVVLLAALGTAWCDRSSTPSRSVPSARGGGPPAPLANPMAQHGVATFAMRYALARGDLEGFRSAAGIFASGAEVMPDPHFRVAFKPVAAAAQQAKLAETTDSQARALAELGLACARCHVEHGRPEVSLTAPPTELRRHVWAADRMWEGLMGPSIDAWSKGADAMSDAPLFRDDPAPVELPVATLAMRTWTSARMGRDATSDEVRATAFAGVYATCSDCHARLGVKLH
jgi:cytochrome c553